MAVALEPIQETARTEGALLAGFFEQFGKVAEVCVASFAVG